MVSMGETYKRVVSMEFRTVIGRTVVRRDRKGEKHTASFSGIDDYYFLKS